MKKIDFICIAGLMLGLGLLGGSAEMRAQEASRSGNAGAKPGEPAVPGEQDAKSGQAFSGMYSFLKEGEFVQVTVEEAGQVTGFVSRFGDGERDQGAFLDQFFKSAKLEGNKLSFTTEIVHGIAFDFKGAVERGEGKNPTQIKKLRRTRGKWRSRCFPRMLRRRNSTGLRVPSEKQALDPWDRRGSAKLRIRIDLVLGSLGTGYSKLGTGWGYCPARSGERFRRPGAFLGEPSKP